MAQLIDGLFRTEPKCQLQLVYCSELASHLVYALCTYLKYQTKLETVQLN